MIGLLTTPVRAGIGVEFSDLMEGAPEGSTNKMAFMVEPASAPDAGLSSLRIR